MTWQLDTVVCGDCLDVMGGMEDSSIDSVVTDPPYGLSKQPDITEVLSHWLAGDDYQHRGGGFMGKTWDSFVPGPSIWREVYRVMKPGGFLLAFGGTRTADLLSIALRLSGFEIRDTLMWLYGSG
jgi:site-specific DNA-methyltransferase (adenine-specific)